MSTTTQDHDFQASDMTLRDYFAGQVLQELLRRALASGSQLHGAGCMEGVAHDAYQVAEAMMKVRQRCMRPTEGTGSASSLAATQAHLADMRRIAFDVLGFEHEARR